MITAVALAATGGLIASTAPASADLVTRCIGTGAAVTVPGDLVVPADRSCSLEGTTVLGDVRVGPNADLIVDGGTIEGAVAVATNAYVDVIETTIGGTVTTRSAYGLYLESSTVGAVTGRGEAVGGEFPPFVYLQDTALSGSLDVRVGEVYLDSTSVGGDVLTRNTDFTDIVDSTLSGSLDVRNNALGAVVCASEIYGDAVYASNSGSLQLGAGGPLSTWCDGATFWGGNVRVDNNTADIQVSNNIVAGDLGGRGNDPAPTGSDNRVRGEVTGQFVDLQPTPDQVGMSLLSRATVDRQTALDGQVEQRLAEADIAAKAAGAADLG